MKKKYKLIQKYPGSTKVGSTIIIDSSQETGYYSENPEFWEEVIQKDYEILSFLLYGDSLCERFSNTFNGYSEKAILEKKEHLIHSVKRLDDGEIFTVGDRAQSVGGYPHVITAIEVRQKNVSRGEKDGIDRIWLNWEENSGGNWLESSEKVKTPLFKTEDGVDVFEGDFYWYVGVDYTYHIKKADKVFIPHIPFSSKAKAKEYITLKEIRYSLEDVLKTVNRWSMIHITKVDILNSFENNQ